jgi:hypothetical protein
MRACVEGRVFDSRRAALASELRGHIEAYECRKCGGWHVRTPRKSRHNNTGAAKQ